MEKKLYPLKFIPIASRRPWGGHALFDKLGKTFVECDERGNENPVGADEQVGESWEIADMGIVDSVVSDGWLAGNSLSELMETYIERIVGENVYNFYGRQFPLLVKFLDINGKLSVQVHPDDEMAAERYDSLGKAELWYVVDARPGAKVYMGFNRDMTAQELYDRCQNDTVDEVLNVICPKKGDVFHVKPGTVHAAEGGVLIAEIEESSDITLRLYDWGREHNPLTARPIHLEEAIDLVDYHAYDFGDYRKGPEWEEGASHEHCSGHECECGDECHCGDEGHECHCHKGGQAVEVLVESPQFNVTKLNLADPLHIYTEKFGSFIIYVCIEGGASVQIPSVNASGEPYMENYEFSKGETVLVPADMPDFYLVPRDRSTVLLEATTMVEEEFDSYIDPSTEAFLEDEDYEGLEDGLLEADSEDESEADGVRGPAGASPLNFFS